MNIKLLKGLIMADEPSLFKVCSEYMEQKYGKANSVIAENFCFAIGTLPILLIAHLDTVLDNPPKQIYANQGHNIWTADKGLGADDRAGLFAILTLLAHNEKLPSVLFTLGEEAGGVGAHEFTEIFPKPPVEIKYVVQIDRRGKGQAVYYNCANEDFENYINSFGFTTYQGIFTDISIICPIWKIAGVNLSAGYEGEHTYGEVLYLDYLQETIEAVQRMIDDIDNAPVYEFKNREYIHCSKCKRPIHEYFSIKIGYKHFCFQCLQEITNVCEECGNLFFPSSENDKYCGECRKCC